jgi:hypothetical protein
MAMDHMGMTPMASTKSPSSTYLIDRRVTSVNPVILKFLPADGQEGVHGRRSFHKWITRSFEMQYELVELPAREEREQQKSRLHRMAQRSHIGAVRDHDCIVM